jgi:hypothetical protein
MKKNGQVSRSSRVTDYAAAAAEQVNHYCMVHPGSPSAVRRPRLLFRSELWIALLGPSMEEGIVGIGSTVPAALRAFDTQYLAGLRPPIETAANTSEPRRPGAARRRPHGISKLNPKSGAGGSNHFMAGVTHLRAV